MALPNHSVEKMFRDNFQGDKGLYVAPEERETLVADLRRRFESDEWEGGNRQGWLPEEQRERHLCSFSLKATEYYYDPDTFYLGLDDEDRLVIQYSHKGRSTSVASLDQIDSFVLDGKRRIERRKALQARRDKVRGFKHSAMEAQLRKMADAEDLDFVTEFTPHRVKLWVKLSGGDNNLIYLHFPLKRFQEMLPRLPELIRTLEQSYQVGVTFKITSRGGLPWSPKWIR